MREGVQLSFSSSEHPKIIEAYSRIIALLCKPHNGECSYADDVDRMVKAHEPASKKWLPSYQTGGKFTRKALSQLKESTLIADGCGRARNTHELGRELAETIKFINGVADIFVLVDKRQLEDGKFPFSSAYKQQIGSMLDNGAKEAVVVILVKTPPKAIRNEVLRATEKEFGGLTSWLNDVGRHADKTSPQLQDYLAHSTIRILCTGSHPGLREMENRLNSKIEGQDGPERHHVARVVRSISEDQKVDALKKVGMICVSMLAAVGVLKLLIPSWINVVGGVLGDIIGAVMPNISQSFKAFGTFRQNLRDIMPMVKGSIVGLGVSFVLGLCSTLIYSEAAPLLQRTWAGLLYGLACSSGAVFVSIAATRDAYREISRQAIAESRQLGIGKKLRMAFQEAQLNVPFRIGSNLVAIPLQIVLGGLSGAFGFFTSGLFIIAEGVMDPILGTLSAFAYPKMAELRHMKKMKGL
ncbi:MAG: hypothetical protein WC717_03230 [Candidatus Micrarchaeia archaeon]|jgi:hypothetical protein